MSDVRLARTREAGFIDCEWRCYQLTDEEFERAIIAKKAGFSDIGSLRCAKMTDSELTDIIKKKKQTKWKSFTSCILCR